MCGVQSNSIFGYSYSKQKASTDDKYLMKAERGSIISVCLQCSVQLLIKPSDLKDSFSYPL